MAKTTTVNLTDINEIDSLLYGIKWGDSLGNGVNLSYSFPWTSYSTAYWQNSYSSTNEAYATYHYGLSLDQITATKSALQSWANIANINFSEIAESSTVVGDFRFAFSSAVTSDSWGWSYAPNNYWANAGDVWINTNQSSNTFAIGSYDYEALIHEIGHGLGLKHPGDYNGGSTGGQLGPFLPADFDNRLYTIMSYNDPTMIRWVDTETNRSSIINPETPMVLDIAAIQYLYGANNSFNSGDDSYSFDNRAPFMMTIWDGGGHDSITVEYSNRSCLIDLTPGHYSNIQTNRIVDVNTIIANNNILNVRGIDYQWSFTNPTNTPSYNLGIAYGAIIEDAIGGSANDILIGNSANNTLNGNKGADKMYGGTGDDTYYVDNVLDETNETSTLITEIDTIISSISRSLGNNIENLTLTGVAGISGAGNNLNNTIIGNSANNILNGNKGADKMYGGTGNDTYYVDNIFDGTYETSTIVTEIDKVVSSVSYSLGANIENLTLTGTDAINAAGNFMNNTIIGNSGNNIINGNKGTDKMYGGTGNDTYYIDNILDRAYETSTIITEIDKVVSSVSCSLGANIENLTLSGMNNINGTGNNLNNVLIGNTGNNILNGSTGVDKMYGGTGRDVYYVDNILDGTYESSTIVTETDRVISSVSRSLGANIENLTLTGLDNINGTGNNLNNAIVGNNGANIINALTGNDTLYGGLGNDTLTGGLGSDLFVFTQADIQTGLDKIMDFDRSQGDKIKFYEIDIYQNIIGIQAPTFIIDQEFSGTAGEIRLFTINNIGHIEADLNGDTIVDYSIDVYFEQAIGQTITQTDIFLA